MDFVPFFPVYISPCAKLPHSFPNAVVHISCVVKSFANFFIVFYWFANDKVDDWGKKCSIGVIVSIFDIENAGWMTGK